jgi:RimJ/RimL family protein N-acetyltransferase
MTRLRNIDYIVRLGEDRDRLSYLRACQRSAARAYSQLHPKSEELFASHHYFHPTIMPYWESMAKNEDNNLWWVVELLSPEAEIIGGISLKTYSGYSEGRGFYISPEWQGRGIGSALWTERRKKIKNPMYSEVYSDAHQAIAFHEKNGAKRTGRQRFIHWDSWPDGITLTALEFVNP